MPIPNTMEGLKKAGYEFTNEKRCSSIKCGEPILWFTTPNGKPMPITKATMEPHWSTCPDAPSFRKRKPTSKPKEDRGDPDEMRSECFELLDRLEDHLENMNPNDTKFVTGLMERREKYDEKTFVSRKQVFWLRDIAERMER